MKKIVAKTLQEAITQASVELGCSVTDLDYEIIQTPSNGFLGIGKKDAIIVATIIEHSNPPVTKNQTTHQPSPEKNQNKPSIINDEDINYEENKSRPSYFDHHLGVQTQENHHGEFEMGKSDIDEVFFKEIQDPHQITQEIESELKELFASMPYKIDKIEVGIYDNQTLLVTLDGDDSALMIGEKGYRYKALSYLLFNWIHPKYGYNIRLEIAQFLKNQEEAIDIYLQSIISMIAETGKAQTKPLDGVLAYIALKKLRDTFPNKYVSFRINAQDERYIIVSDFIKNE
ncbi:Jag N-terminal domain-containing protein [Helicobacter cappadocius]|uniref:Jag N-terminal domain-containing protein n=1 Tax=Helicobacter cappadocius TaxID=3063998 RepID=A0AA90PKE8_9HELI|nr:MULTISPECIES: Jag N-terminal domain-containing protein [unclassified Helicobacter]MDO7253623.1 Jag N-terminal domain-containing protein [Helicobacter sp. faydin-H75]MDP2539551.1 Jag N-terminal domain-containing protein [Helicobacter sp. faydin-H76]